MRPRHGNVTKPLGRLAPKIVNAEAKPRPTATSKSLRQRHHFMNLRPTPCNGGEQCPPGVRPQFDRHFEADDPRLPEDLVVSPIDGEQRPVAIGALDQRARDLVIVLHHEAENAVEVVEVNNSQWPLGRGRCGSQPSS